MDLPVALHPWAAALSAVSPDVAASLGPWLGRLAPAVGPLRTRTLAGRGDPDGYDGIVRRGSYERLLLSEWLLADEIPEEFVRRAAMGEHAFHRVAYREQAKARTSVALLDAGPSQLGSPRIAHLAALIVLAQRAHDAGARFGWAVMQRPPGDPLGDGGLRLGVTPANVDRVLQARSALGVGDADLDAWVALANGPAPWEDVWVVGPRSTWARWLARAPRRPGATGGCIEAEDVVVPGARKLSVRVHQRGMVRPLELELPDDATCARLLRGSLAWTKATVRNAAPRAFTAARTPASNPVFTASGTKVIARNANGDLVVCGVPNTARGGNPKPKIIHRRDDESVLAAGWAGRRLVLLTRRADGLHLYDWHGDVFPPATSLRTLPEGSAGALPACAPEAPLATVHVFRAKPGAPREAAVLDGQQRLWRFRASKEVSCVHDVVAATVDAERLKVCVARPPPPSLRNEDEDVLFSLADLALVSRLEAEHASLAEGVVTLASAHRAYFVRSEAAVVLPTGDDILCVPWRAVLASKVTVDAATVVPTDHTVVGATVRHGHDKPPAMVTLPPDRRSVVVWRGTSPTKHADVPEGVRHLAVDPNGARFAIVTDAGSLLVLDAGDTLVDLRAGGKP